MRDYYTTSQVAALLSVSADTVLKWVRAGKIPSYRTPGGHARIPARIVEALLPHPDQAVSPGGRIRPARPRATVPAFRHCWQYYAGEGALPESCLECVVYRSRASRCYEMRAIPEEFGHLKLHCRTSCDDCEYYQRVQGRQTGVLVVTGDAGWRRRFEASAGPAGLRLGVAGSEYESAIQVGRLRPDYVVLDASLGKARVQRICAHLEGDDRIPFARVIIASRRPGWAAACERTVSGWIRKPFTLEQLRGFVTAGAESRRGPSRHPPA